MYFSDLNKNESLHVGHVKLQSVKSLCESQ